MLQFIAMAQEVLRRQTIGWFQIVCTTVEAIILVGTVSFSIV